MATRIHPHGDNRRYVINRCRCTPCRAAHAAEAKRRERAIAYGRWEGLIDATGTIRRVRALLVADWPHTYLAERRGVTPSAIRKYALGRSKRVQASTAREYALLYDELCSEDGPWRPTGTLSKRKGWHGPEAWTDDTIDDPDAVPFQVPVFDEVAVRRALAGKARYGRLSDAERVEAYRRMCANGMGQGAIKDRLNINADTYRRLVELTEQAGPGSGQVAA